MAQTAEEIGADILIVSEPATRNGHEDRWCFSTDRKAAVGTSLRSELDHDGRGSESGFAWLSLRGLTVFSCYCRPGASLPEYRLFLGDLEAAIRARGGLIDRSGRRLQRLERGVGFKN